MSIKITLAQDTTAKLRPEQSSGLPDTQKMTLPKGLVIEPETLIRVNGHLAFTVYLFEGHAKVEGEAPPKSKTLTEADYCRVAARLGCEVAAIKAVIAVESAGGGYIKDGRPKILFEAHHFGRLTQFRYNQSHPHLSRTRWTKGLYRNSSGEWDRLNEAIALNRGAALQSASWGLGQMMGFNFAFCGFTTVEEFAAAMHESEGRQLDAMFAFLQRNHLDKFLREKDWGSFARWYNGPDYKENAYDRKLLEAYRRFV